MGRGVDRVNQWKDTIRAMLAWQSPNEQQARIFFFFFAKPPQAPCRGPMYVKRVGFQKGEESNRKERKM